MIRYARAPSSAFASLLSSSPLLKSRVVAGLPVDPQLREGDHLHLYCGLTRLLDASLFNDTLRLSAHPTYTSQPCGADLFREWSPQDPALSAALDHYFANVVVKPAQVRGEGAVQARWAQVRDPWISFDREGVIGYEDSAARSAARSFPTLSQARSEIEALAGSWGPVPKTGGEVDQLAVDPQGRLVLLELKDSSSPAYYAPLQLLQYLHEWAGALPTLHSSLMALMESRKTLGLSPEMPPLSGGLRAVLAFGEGRPSTEVQQRLMLVKMVVNRYLPEGVEPMEVWSLEQGAPVRWE